MDSTLISTRKNTQKPNKHTSTYLDEAGALPFSDVFFFSLFCNPIKPRGCLSLRIEIRRVETPTTESVSILRTADVLGTP